MTNKNKIIFIIFSVILLTGIFVCCICDIVISQKLTWSLIPLSSIIFTWFICTPLILLGKKGAAGSLISVSLFIFPYLYILSGLLNVKTIFSIGGIMAIIFDFYLWTVFLILKQFGIKNLFAYGIVLLSAIPFLLIINAALARLIAEPFLDLWDILTIAALLLLSAPLLAYSHFQKRK